MRDAQGFEHHRRDGVVAHRREMQAVRGPHPRVRELPQGPEISDHTVMAHGDGPDVLVEDGDPPAVMSQQGCVAPVGAGEQHDGGAGGTEPAHRGVQGGSQPVGIAPVEHNVIPAGRERDQVRFERNRGPELPVQDLAQEQAADGEVRVPEIRPALAEFLGDPVRPAPHAARTQRFRVPEARGERIPHCDIAGPRPRIPGPCGRARIPGPGAGPGSGPGPVSGRGLLRRPVRRQNPGNRRRSHSQQYAENAGFTRYLGP